MTPRRLATRWTRKRGRGALPAEMRLDLVAAVYDNLFPIVMMGLAAASLGGAIVLSNGDPVLAGIFGFIVLTALVRVGIVLARRPRPGAVLSPHGVRARERLFAAGSFSFAAALGGLGARTVAIGTPHETMLVVALVSGYSAGVVARVSPRPWIAIPSLALAVLPTAVALGLQGSLGDAIAGAALLMFGSGGIQAIGYIHSALLGHLRMRRHLAGLARHDALTGLANRLQLEERLAAELARLQESSGIAALHYLDLDGFKGVNDSFGHRTGDLVLKEVATRLGSLLRPGDVAARIGGDEFVIMQTGCAHPDEAELLARRIGRAIVLPFRIRGQDISIATSVGVAIAPTDGTTPESWIDAADAALYRAKARGRNRVAMADDGEAA